ncbi:flagellar hook-associated protein FlgK [Endozoicomonas sp. GU-1]|uniref:flagellar hook-associated protein FlgK n=1 Tax=Endozoicomonas sp. GU-1 TaxID=3009078 RepID=UPI0022B542EC|nr:flagellar hook-associated protein FlgK [Endozoicomonas sp. GU-1]WBA82485.1 flagellar hook-associated protein FlgK [Endozoicomonas sp. GU-1]WBA85417.1 flagellar hook-associated protein FlgK [Endozoicomonas sp. GU-1]
MTVNHIGLSGVNTADILLNNTAHNIANAETPWFSRRQPVLITQQSHWGGLLNQLGGVRVLYLMQVSNDYLNDQVFRASASQSMADSFAVPMVQLDQLLGGDDTGLTRVLNGFIGNLQRLETRPESLPLRQQWLGSAGQLVDRFHTLGQQLQVISQQRTSQIRNVITEANRLGAAIADLNKQIIEGNSSNHKISDGNCADLLDQRDNLINQLSEQVSVEVYRNSNNAVNLVIPSSQGAIPLIIGTQYFDLSINPDAADPTNPDVMVNIPGVAVPVTPQQGQLAGLQKLHRDGLMPVINQLGRMAVVLASEVNSQLELGVDLVGDKGKPLFQDINSTSAMQQRVLPSTVSGTEALTVAIGDISRLVPSEYQLVFTASDQCRVTRLSDGQSFSGSLTAATPFTIDGLTIHLTGTPAINDQFLLTPWRHEATQLSIVLNDPEQLAFAAQGSGPGDNRNLLALLGCLNGDSASSPDVLEANILLQSSVANQTASAVRQQKTSQSLYQAAVAEREGLSGVNLDEEAANLLRFQQFYQANARLLRTSQMIIDELLAVCR